MAAPTSSDSDFTTCGGEAKRFDVAEAFPCLT